MAALSITGCMDDERQAYTCAGNKCVDCTAVENTGVGSNAVGNSAVESTGAASKVPKKAGNR